MRDEKKSVKDFYENYGWERTDEGIYKDTAAFVDVRPVMESYHARSMLRLANHFAQGGALFLDAGCGALASESYIRIGEPFTQRVCIDISVKALREARIKLGEEAWFVAADISALPFRENLVDGVLCAHVLYHLPKEEQAPAMMELHRVLRCGGMAIIVYTWAACLITKFALALNPRVVVPKIPGMRFLWRTFLKPRRLFRPSVSVPAETTPTLYFFPQDYAWYRNEIATRAAVSLSCWQAVSLPFSQAFVPDNAFGAALLNAISWMERMFPAFMGRIGAYPLFILRKPKQS